ncbi:hypothetical protein FVB32_12955 [Flagellimonas hymeniacidonis]|uniref:Uncharacterized protein n=1 Tax=Flagellimonas hymeniacidonis TaxID=2603628 RepID=A0A5C8V131_9FLAO|nr:hypothetical protein [Flagellimonas hymeniacidonis]TXN35483.1 hypothetical protein FVB32_12955 [Flagellimonas hymeniacidonis]
MIQLKRLTGICSLSLLLLFGGCDEIFECIFNINPEIHNKQLLIGFVGERYSDIVTAEISNEVNDNDYDYFFDVIGELPPGIFYDFNRRSVEFFGTPEETGTYRFTVELFVEGYDYDGYDRSPTCSESTVREFTIQVVE